MSEECKKNDDNMSRPQIAKKKYNHQLVSTSSLKISSIDNKSLN